MTDIAIKPAESENRKFIRRLLRRKTVAFGLVILVIFVLLAVLAPWVAPYSPSKLSIVNRLKPPSGTYFFGTDEFGRDVLSRTIYAGRLSLLVGVAVVALSSVIGVTLGLLAGFFKKLDTPIARLIDAMMAFPDILLAIALVAALGPSLTTVIIALSIVYAPRLARIVRASTLVIRELPYVEAAQALGISTFHIMTRHVLRNLLSPIMVQATFLFASAMLAEAGLSFLGLGIKEPTPSWGALLSNGPNYYLTQPWLMVWPGLAVLMTTLAFNLLGDGLRDAFDPRGTTLS